MEVKINKIPIASGKVYGNLNENIQIYDINFMPKETIEDKEYCSKIEVAINLVDKDGNYKDKYRSIRFVANAQLKSFIVNLIKAYIFMGKQNGEITPNNFIYKIEQFNRLILEEVRR